MMRVTNATDMPLTVAGTAVRAKATVGIERTRLDAWRTTPGARHLIDAEAIVIAERADDRDALMEEARALGLAPPHNTGAPRLREMIDEATDDADPG